MSIDGKGIAYYNKNFTPYFRINNASHITPL